ncbi:MAG: hypothetical protein KDI06_03190 [Calditrichaeota bacterium]|nr:hypothetical protein [Calditrichota bacterium]HQU72566.1 hypothetical protein [Calditrichia bacterium]
MMQFRAAAPPGLESILEAEARRHGFLQDSEKTVVSPLGGIFFSGDWPVLSRANLLLRAPARITVQLPAFRADSFSELVTKARRLPWEYFLAPQSSVHFNVACRKSRLYHSDAVEERLRGAVLHKIGKKVRFLNAGEATQHGAQLIQVRLNRDVCYIEVDSSGEHLRKRGYRPALGKAPLREHLAAAMLLFAGWDGHSPLIDPFCGSGTLLWEGYHLFRGVDTETAQEQLAKLPLSHWPVFQSGGSLLPALAEAEVPHPDVASLLFGSDRNQGAIDDALENARLLGLADRVSLKKQAFSAIEPMGEKGWIVANLPYGVRTAGKGDLRNLYAKLGNLLRERFGGWRFAFLSNSEFLLGHSGLKFQEQLTFDNGGIRVLLVRGEIA